jgi:hypothetical protein
VYVPYISTSQASHRGKACTAMHWHALRALCEDHKVNLQLQCRTQIITAGKAGQRKSTGHGKVKKARSNQKKKKLRLRVQTRFLFFDFIVSHDDARHCPLGRWGCRCKCDAGEAVSPRRRCSCVVMRCPAMTVLQFNQRDLFTVSLLPIA